MVSCLKAYERPKVNHIGNFYCQLPLPLTRVPTRGGRWGEWPAERSAAAVVMVEMVKLRILDFRSSNGHHL